MMSSRLLGQAFGNRYFLVMAPRLIEGGDGSLLPSSACWRRCAVAKGGVPFGT